MSGRASDTERKDFTDALIQEFPEHPAADVAEVARMIMRHSTTYHRLQEKYCNEPFTEADEKHETVIENSIRALCYKLYVPGGVGRGHKAKEVIPVFQGDPRGATVKLRLPSGRTNDWGREGYCVPTS
jgi:hypothetical protein